MINDKVVFIGGVGGSGTRVVAQIVNALGIPLGSNLNGAFDNLDWPAPQIAPLLRDRTRSYEDKFTEMSSAFISFANKMDADSPNATGTDFAWGTKVPGSFFYLRYLSELFENVRYIHIVRHGLDMAYSKNHNQLFNWGGYFNIVLEDGATPRHLLKYWACANSHALENCRAWLPNQHLVIKFEDLCSNRLAHVHQIASFLGLRDVDAAADEISMKIKKQKSQGRYKKLAQPDMFDASDISVLEQLGYTVDWTGDLSN